MYIKLRKGSNSRASRSLSPNPSTKQHKKKSAKKKAKQAKTNSKPKYSHLNTPSLQSIHSDDEEDEFHDMLSPKHGPPSPKKKTKRSPKSKTKTKTKTKMKGQQSGETKEKIKSAIDNIFSDDLKSEKARNRECTSGN